MTTLKAVMFDFGGVLAEEGFREGLKVIAKKNNLDPDRFFEQAREIIYQSGYVTGQSDEAAYWERLRSESGIAGSNNELREEILGRFVMRARMLEHVENIRQHEIITAILSDQTNWLDELNQRSPFSHYFDYVFNSFSLKKSKRDPSIFLDAVSHIGTKPEEALFIDDDKGHVERASHVGCRVIHFKSIDDFEEKIKEFI